MTLYQIFRKAAQELEKLPSSTSRGGCLVLHKVAPSSHSAVDLMQDLFRVGAMEEMREMRGSGLDCYWGLAFGSDDGGCTFDLARVRQGRLLMLDFLAEICRGVPEKKTGEFVRSLLK